MYSIKGPVCYPFCCSFCGNLVLTQTNFSPQTAKVLPNNNTTQNSIKSKHARIRTIISRMPIHLVDSSFWLITSSKTESLNSGQVCPLRWTLVQRNISSWLRPECVLTCPNNWNLDKNIQILNGPVFKGLRLQWGLEFQTFKFRTHLKSKHFKVRFTNGSVCEWSEPCYSYGYSHEWTIWKPNFQNGRSKLGRFK